MNLVKDGTIQRFEMTIYLLEPAKASTTNHSFVAPLQTGFKRTG